MSIMTATGRGAQAGVLIRNAEALERFARVDTLIVDKTGTLTVGKPKLAAVLPAAGRQEDEVLRLAASLERGSEHPLAAAIVSGAEERGIELARADSFEALTGKGVKGVVDGQALALGNAALLTELGLDGGTSSAFVEAANARRDEGETVMFILIGAEIAGLLARRCAICGRTCSLPWSTTLPGWQWPPASFTLSWGSWCRRCLPPRR